MKKLFNIHHVPANLDTLILFIRIAIAALMLTHGLPKMAMLLSSDPIMFPPMFGMTPFLSLSLAVFAEVLCSIFILVGFGTRLASIPLIITMLVAVVAVHGADPFVKKEMGILYLLVYLILLVTGSGKYSVDGLLHRKQVAVAKAEYKMR